VLAACECLSCAGGGGRGAQPSNPDDWVCDKCSNVNYARRSKCNRCEEPKPGGGFGTPAAAAKHKYAPGSILTKEQAEKSAGMHKEGDWCCAKSANRQNRGDRNGLPA